VRALLLFGEPLGGGLRIGVPFCTTFHQIPLALWWNQRKKLNLAAGHSDSMICMNEPSDHDSGTQGAEDIETAIFFY
jgi:hypothetical protein